MSSSDSGDMAGVVMVPFPSLTKAPRTPRSARHPTCKHRGERPVSKSKRAGRRKLPGGRVIARAAGALRESRARWNAPRPVARRSPWALLAAARAGADTKGECAIDSASRRRDSSREAKIGPDILTPEVPKELDA